MEAALCGRFANPELRQLLERSLEQVSPIALRRRLGAVARVDVSAKLQQVTAPVLYLRALEDRLVGAASATEVMSLAKGSKVVEFIAPHFLLQCVSAEAASTIRLFIEREATAV